MNNKQLEFYIATDGCDEHEGSLRHPFKTLKKAIEIIREQSEYVESITFVIREGEYRLNESLVFDEKIISKSNVHIYFKNYQNEKVVISGGEILETKWEKYNEDIYVAEIGVGHNFDVLLADGVIQVLCRYPNYIEGEVLNGYSEQALATERVARWNNPAGGYIRALHEKDWGGNSYIIKGKTRDNQLIYEWVGDNNRGSKHSLTKVMVENIFEELDCEKEWYYDSVEGKLYFYPPKGMDLEQTVFEGAKLEELFILKGKSNTDTIKYITLDGLEFTCTHRSLFTKTYERPLRGDWAIARTGAIYLENTEHVSIKNCKFYDLGGNAVMMSGYNKKHSIDSNDFVDIGATGILVVGLQEATRDPSTWDNSNHKTIIKDYESGPQSEDYPRDIIISNNYIYNSGIYEKQSAGVCLSISEYITVAKNTIHHVPRAAINVSDGTFGGHIIEGNDLFDCVRETGDHGPFNSWGRDRFWSAPEYNTTGLHGAEKRPYAVLDARSTTIIRNNRIHAYHAFGIDLDDGSSNYEICNNLCLGVGIKTREGFDRKVYNNVLIGCCLEVHCSYALNNDKFFNNIIYNHKAYNFIAINEGHTTQFKNNIYWNDGEKIIGIGEEDTGYLIKDPEFENPGNNDYSVKDTSPALQRGFINFPMTNEDFGRADKPNPPIYRYVNASHEEEYYEIDEAKLVDITNDGLLSAAGLPDYNGTYIMEIPAIGWWVEQGFRITDVIRKINNKRILNTEEFIKCYKEINEGVEYSVEIYRNQQSQILRLNKDKMTNCAS